MVLVISQVDYQCPTVIVAECALVYADRNVNYSIIILKKFILKEGFKVKFFGKGTIDSVLLENNFYRIMEKSTLNPAKS